MKMFLKRKCDEESLKEQHKNSQENKEKSYVKKRGKGVKNLMKRNERMPKIVVAFITAAIVLTNGGLVLATNNKIKKVNVSEKDFEDDSKKEIEKWEKNRGIELEKETSFSNENSKFFRKFKKEEYEVEGFKLTVYFKNGVPILFYEHIKTGAKIIMIPTDTLDESLIERLGDMYFFKASVPNDSGIVHLAEHCIASPGMTSKLNEKFKNLDYNAGTDGFGFRITLKSKPSTEEVDKEIFSLLKSPKILKDKELFEKEKRRAIIEVVDNIKNLYGAESEEFYSSGGIPEEMEKVNFEEVRKFCEDYINPSNLLVTKNVKLDAKKIKNYLKNMEKYYLKFYSKKEVKQPKYGYKKFFPYRKIKSDSDYVFNYVNSKGEIKNFKYVANLSYFDRESFKKTFEKYDYNLKLNPILNLGLNYLNRKKTNELNEFVKKMGYKEIEFNSIVDIKLFGDNHELFKEEKLREVNHKIFNFVLNKFKNFSEEDILLNSEILKPTNYDLKAKFKYDSAEYFANPLYFNKYMGEVSGSIYGLGDLFTILNFFYGTPFERKILNIDENNNIINTEKEVIKKTKEGINNLEKLIDEKDLKILVSEKAIAKEKDKTKKEDVNRWLLIPLEVKAFEQNNVLKMLVSEFLIKMFHYEIVYNKALNYYGPGGKNFIGKYIGYCEVTSLKLKDIMINYFYNDSIEFIKNLKILKEEFEKLKKNFKKTEKKELENIEEKNAKFKRLITVVDDYINNKSSIKLNEEDIKIDEKTKIKDLYETLSKKYHELDINKMYSDYEDFINSFKLGDNFVKKYKLEKETGKDVLINKEFAKEFKEKIERDFKHFKYAEKFNKEVMEKINSISYEDFVKAVKSVSLVEKSVFEKDQKVEDELNS